LGFWLGVAAAGLGDGVFTPVLDLAVAGFEVGVDTETLAVGVVFEEDDPMTPPTTTSARTTPIAIALVRDDQPVRRVRTIPTGKQTTRPTIANQLGTPPRFTGKATRLEVGNAPGGAATGG